MRILFFLVIAFLALKYLGRVESKPTVYYEMTNKVNEVNKMRKLRDLLLSLGIKFPEVVIAQMLLETANCTSKIFKENKNSLGMKHNSRGLSVGVLNGHASYRDYADGFEDYRQWQNRCLSLRRDIQTTDDYIRMLDNLPICSGCRYAEDPLYTQKVRAKLRVVRMILNDGQQQSVMTGK